MKRKFRILLFLAFLLGIFVALSGCEKQEPQVGRDMELTLTEKYSDTVILEDARGERYSITKEVLEEYINFDALTERQIVTVTYMGGIRETSPAEFSKIIGIKIGK